MNRRCNRCEQPTERVLAPKLFESRDGGQDLSGEGTNEKADSNACREQSRLSPTFIQRLPSCCAGCSRSQAAGLPGSVLFPKAVRLMALADCRTRAHYFAGTRSAGSLMATNEPLSPPFDSNVERKASASSRAAKWPTRTRYQVCPLTSASTTKAS